ncbi:MAG TPA: hypothetical protein VFG84_11470 [Gemmatimonadaceae bacterium]|nr:hypothetical protein [Gemmatimonadaceae bacterium]
MRGSWLVVVSGMVLSASVAFAQGKPPKREKSDPPRSEKKVGSEREVPRSHKPPAGLCRIWLNGVPAAQQPAPTDCASAVRNRPANAKVIFPEEREAPRVQQLQPLRSLENRRRVERKQTETRDPRTPTVRPSSTSTPPVRKPTKVRKPDDPAQQSS